MDFKFNIHDKVDILELGVNGVVVNIWIGIDQVAQYKVRYFWQGKAEEVYFYDWELISPQQERKIK